MTFNNFIELFKKGKAVLSFASDCKAFGEIIAKFKELNIPNEASKNGVAASSVKIAWNAREIRAQDIVVNAIEEDIFMSFL